MNRKEIVERLGECIDNCPIFKKGNCDGDPENCPLEYNEYLKYRLGRVRGATRKEGLE